MIRKEEDVPPVIGAGAPEPVRKERAPALYVIVAFKLLKGIFLLLAGFGIYAMMGLDLHQEFLRMAGDLNLDPANGMMAEAGKRLQSVTPENIRMVALGTVLYSIFSLVEGTGLILRLTWGAWMAIGESAVFIPVELYDLLQSFSFVMLAILILNALVVWYLYDNRHRLFHSHSTR